MIRTDDFNLVYSAMRKWASLASGMDMYYAMQDALAILLEEVQANIPVESGDLMEDANIRMVEFSPGKIVSGGVTMMKNGRQKPYAWMREKGGTIVPRPENRKQMLFWVDKADGTWHAARRVEQKGSFYMEKSLVQKKAVIVEALAGGVTGAFRVFD